MFQFNMDQTVIKNLMLEIDKLQSNGIHVIFLATDSTDQGIKAIISKATGWGESFLYKNNIIDAFQQHCLNLARTAVIEMDHLICKSSKAEPESRKNNPNIKKDGNKIELAATDLDLESKCIFNEEIIEEETLYNSENALECYTCGKAFFDFDELIVHMNEHNVIDDNNLTCTLCSLTFNNQQEYIDHDELVHMRVLDVVYQSLLDTNTEDLHEELENNFLPNITTSADITPRGSNIRLDVIDVPKTLSLKQSFETKRNTLSCVSRMRTNKKVGHECTICNRIIFHRSHFELHMRSHRDERPFECFNCGKKYLAIQHLHRHIQSIHRTNPTGYGVHNSNEPCVDFKPVEDELFADFNIKQEKTFICKECGRCFNRSHNLKVHVLRHEMSSKGLKPEMCQMCGKQFRTKHCLKVHQSSHHAEKSTFKCPQCYKNFFTRLSRLHHIDRRHGIMCSFCSVKFNDANERNKHEKIQHNIRFEYVRKSLSEGKIVPN